MPYDAALKYACARGSHLNGFGDALSPVGAILLPLTTAFSCDPNDYGVVILPLFHIARLRHSHFGHVRDGSCGRAVCKQLDCEQARRWPETPWLALPLTYCRAF